MSVTSEWAFYMYRECSFHRGHNVSTVAQNGLACGFIFAYFHKFCGHCSFFFILGRAGWLQIYSEIQLNPKHCVNIAQETKLLIET